MFLGYSHKKTNFLYTKSDDIKKTNHEGENMGRMVVSKKDVQPPEESAEPTDVRIASVGEPTPEIDSYISRLFKYIPAEVVALYLLLDGLVGASGHPQSFLMQLVIFIALIIGTPLYLWRMQKVDAKKKPIQLVLSTVAFILWVLAIGGIFTYFGWYDPLWGAILVPIYTFLVALVEA